MTELRGKMSNSLIEILTRVTVTDRSRRQKISKTVGCLYSTDGCSEYVENDIRCKCRMYSVSVSLNS